jgi:hypothetical protein
MNKNGPDFWKCWRSKLEQSSICDEVEGCIEVNVIIAKFHEHFAKLHNTTNLIRATELRNEYSNQRAIYKGFPIVSTSLIDTDLVSNIIDNSSHGIAVDLDGLVAEHLRNCHPLLSCILFKLFNLILTCVYIPSGFCVSYTVPLPKVKDCRTAAVTCDYFRGIAILYYLKFFNTVS